jgi:superfamily II DNA/RNA helicase
VSNALTEQNHQVSTIHSGLDQEVHNEIMRKFRKGETRILLISNLLARGCYTYEILNF